MNTTDTAPLNPIHRWAGWVLIAFGLLMPILAGGFMGMDASRAGEFTTRGIGSFAVLGGLAWAFTRKKSVRARANGLIIAGMLLCLTVWTNISTSIREEAEARVFLREALDLQQRYTAKAAEFRSRFDKLPLATILTPANLTSMAGIERSKAVIAQIRALIAERRALTAGIGSETTQFIAGIASERARQSARKNLEEALNLSEKYDEDLSAIQVRTADALEAILDFCAAHQGPGMQAVKGQLLFADAADLAKFENLRLAVTSLADQEDKLNADSAAWRERIERTQKRAAADATLYLSK